MSVEVEMSMSALVQLPVTPESEVYWRGLTKRELWMQRCTECRSFRHPARFICSECLSREFAWERLSGRGTVETFVWYLDHLHPHHAPLPVPPYNVAIVRVDEGPRIVTNVEGVPFGALSVGDVVVASFEKVAEEWAVLRFKRTADDPD